MIINAGTPGSNNWRYHVNPLFVSLDQKYKYDTIGIGYYAYAYGNPEKVYLWPNMALADLGYELTDLAFNLVGGTAKQSTDMRNMVSQSTALCHYSTYKWAIARVENWHGTAKTGFVVFRNINGVIEQENPGDPPGRAWKSIYKNSLTHNYSWGASDANTITLFDYGQTYSSEYDPIIFDCEDFTWDDPGYQAMLNYLSSEEEYGHDPDDKDKDPYENLKPGNGPDGGHPDGRIYEIVDEPDLPTLSAINTGFVSLYTGTEEDLNHLADDLWATGSNSFVNQLIKNYQNPFESILSLSIIPFTVSGTNRGIKIGNYQSNVEMDQVNSQYVSLDLGGVSISEEFGAYLDYAPYTKLTLYLPYIGFVPLNTDEYMSKELTVKYHVDLLTGSCVAYLFVNGSVHSQYTGNLATPIPVSGRDMSTLYNGMLNVGLAAIGVAVAPGLTVAAEAGHHLSSSVSQVVGSKERIQVGGTIQGSSGFLGIQKPYIVVEAPNICVPSRQNYFNGYPSFITSTLGSLSGYTEVDSCHLEGIPCTASELEEIEKLLKGGVIL